MVNWKQIGAIAAGVLVVGAGTFGVVDLKNGQDTNADALNNIKLQIEEANAEEVVAVEEVVVPTQLDEVQVELDAIKLKLFEEDAWEAEAEVLAMEETEDDDYEVLYDFMVKPVIDGGLGLLIDDERDIEEVIIQDVDVTSTNVDDKDAAVTHDLKVYYEDADGDNKKVYLTVESDVEEGEVEDQTITETA